ncbi:MAG: peptidoglycan -binding protein [Proteobacteria bacterium]|nr:peptidoglycan -binding protein [Pseudomonadota bacterium]MDA1357688.1 peptidoglycan -binding protein [Pseudomonadota bacterium]
MSYGSRSRRHQGGSSAIWPGFVDVLSTLLLVMIFLLVVYMLAQYFLQRSVSEKSAALTELDHQVAELADLLSLERQSNTDLRTNISQLSSELQSSLAERDALSLALTRSEDESNTLRLRLRDMTAEAQTALSDATEANRVAVETQLRAEAGEEKIRVMLSDVEQLRRDIAALQTVRSDLEERVVELAAALRDSEGDKARLDQAFSAARDRSTELMAKLSDESERTALAQKELGDRDVRLSELQGLYMLSENQLMQARDLTARQSDEIGVLNQQILALRAQLTRIEEALDTSEAESKEQNVVIADLGRRLNLALAAKVEELAEYRSEFFGRLRQVLAGRQGFTIIGDRFVFQSEVLFGSGSAELGIGGKLGLNTFATVLKEVMTRIPEDLPWILQVDGHTDRIPIQTARFPSNWELSAARAIEVVNYLVTRGIPPERLSATGYGQFQPLDTRDDEIAHRRNRRIELKLTQR